MKIRFIISIFLLLNCFLFSCKKPGCLGSAGPITTEVRQINGYRQLILADNISVELIQSNMERLEIEGPQNILPNIITTVSNQAIEITNVSDCEWARNPDEKIHVKLYFINLDKIDYRGSGNITNRDTLKLDYLQIESNIGAGDINLTLNNKYTGSYIFKENAHIVLHGKSEVCYTYTNARAKSDMSDFVVKKMVIEYGGLADTYINVTDELDAILFWRGNIYYKGNPVVTRSQVYSTGQLIHIP